MMKIFEKNRRYWYSWGNWNKPDLMLRIILQKSWWRRCMYICQLIIVLCLKIFLLISFRTRNWWTLHISAAVFLNSKLLSTSPLFAAPSLLNSQSASHFPCISLLLATLNGANHQMRTWKWKASSSFIGYILT